MGDGRRRGAKAEGADAMRSLPVDLAPLLRPSPIAHRPSPILALPEWSIPARDGACVVIPLSEVRVLDANAEALGVPTWRLVQNAGRAVADAVATLAPQGDIAVLAGKGNNGADGREAARVLAERGRRVAVLSPHEHAAPA